MIVTGLILLLIKTYLLARKKCYALDAFYSKKDTSSISHLLLYYVVYSYLTPNEPPRDHVYASRQTFYAGEFKMHRSL